MKRAIREHRNDFIAILGLLVLSVIVSVYILDHERLHFPFVNSPETINAEFSTAQAVEPGQGQYVTISGVQIGLIGKIQVQSGLAVVQLQIQPKYKNTIHTNATALLRPRTGLKDMFVEIDPGTSNYPVVKPGFTIPISNTNPDVNTDEILSSLDANTRAYLDLLVNGAGNGLDNKGDQLAQVLERFEPTDRDLGRLNGAVAARGSHLRTLVNSLRRLNTALAQKQTQIVSLIDASQKVFSAFASQNADLSRAVADLPGTLTQTSATLAKVQTFAEALGPAAHNLIPAADALPSANQALITLANPNGSTCGSGSTCSEVRDQIRPFVRQAQPLVRNLRPTSINLAKSTPNLSRTFTVLNHLFNILGYNPGDSPSGGQHGYLWWLAWLGHNARTLFSVQDANGIFRPLFVQLSCQQLGLLTQQPPSSPLSPLTTLVSSSSLFNLSPSDAACQLAGLGGTNPNPGLSALLPPQVTSIVSGLGLSKDSQQQRQAKASKSAKTAGSQTSSAKAKKKS